MNVKEELLYYPPALALAAASVIAKCKNYYIKLVHVMGKALTGEPSCMQIGLVFFYRVLPYIKGF